MFPSSVSALASIDFHAHRSFREVVCRIRLEMPSFQWKDARRGAKANLRLLRCAATSTKLL